MKNIKFLLTFSALCSILWPNSLLWSQERQEITSRRGYNSKTFLNSDGTYTTEISAGYVHYQNARGEFVDMNRNFRSSAHPSYSFEVTEGLYQVFFDKNPTTELPFTFRLRNGAEIKARLTALAYFDRPTKNYVILSRVANISPTLAGNEITYQNVFPDVNVKYFYTDTKFKEEIHFSQTARNNLPDPTTLGFNNDNVYLAFLTKFEMDSTLDAFVNNVKISQKNNRREFDFEGEDQVDFKNSRGELQFLFPKDYAFVEAFRDSAEAASQSKFILRRIFTTAEGHFILSTVPLKWVQSRPQGTIIFDPQIAIQSPVHDTWIESYPNSNSNFGGYQNIRVGRGGSNGWKRTLLKFDVSGAGIPANARIISATCKLYWWTIWNGGSPKNRPVFVHQMLKDWTETGATWNQGMSGVPWTNGVSFNDIDAKSTSEDVLVWPASGYPKWMEYNVTNLAKRWINGISPNYGMIFWAADEDDYTNADEKWAYSKEFSDQTKHPKLIINYTPSDLAQYTYYPSGTIHTVTMGQDVITGSYLYHPRDWITDITYTDINSQIRFELHNTTFDDVGNITAQTYTNLSQADNLTYFYDELNRLTNANSNLYNDLVYAYDKNGNIESKTINGAMTDYQYTVAGKPNRLKQVGTRIYDYWEDGSIKTDGTKTLNYDYKNQLTSITGSLDQAYLYDADGLRVKKSEGVVTSGTGYNVISWTSEVTSAVGGVLPTAGPSMYRITVKTDAVAADHFTNELIVLEDGLNIPITSSSYLEYDIRAAQTTNLRASVQFQYYDPGTQEYTYSWFETYQDQNGRSNVWNTDLNSVYVNQWYHRVFPLGTGSLAGKIIKKVVFMTNDDPTITTGAETDVFYCDEIKINGIDIGKANGAASAPTAFYENFNDGNIDDGVPVDWYTTGSYWNASTGELKWTSTAEISGQCSHPNLTFDNFEAEYDLMADGYFSTIYWAAFAFRKTNYGDWYGTSGYMLYYRYNGNVNLYRAGWGNLLPIDHPTGKDLSTWRHVKIVANGSNIKVYVDGVFQFEVTDGTFTKGYFGLNVFGVAARYDNLTVNGNPFKNEVYYIRDADGEVLAEYDGAGNLLAEYVSANGQRIAKINPTGTVDLYLNDHLGSARAMVGSGWSANYYPFGEIASQTGSDEDTRYDFTGKERDRGTALLYFGARYYDPEIGRFVSVDRFADKYPSHTPYHYTLNNPVRFIDINGDSTFVTVNEDRTYTVTGGNLSGDEDDTGIFTRDADGNLVLVGRSITTHSFFDDEGNAVVGAVIDPTSYEGVLFVLGEIIGADPSLIGYMRNATEKEKYDFKNRGVKEALAEGVKVPQHHYRGSAVPFTGSAATFGSARDFGNIGAGIVAGRAGLSWEEARLGLDALESIQRGKISKEGTPTQKAQQVGHAIGVRLRKVD